MKMVASYPAHSNHEHWHVWVHLPLSCVEVWMLSGCQTLSTVHTTTGGLGKFSGYTVLTRPWNQQLSISCCTAQSVNATPVNAKLWPYLTDSSLGSWGEPWEQGYGYGIPTILFRSWMCGWQRPQTQGCPTKVGGSPRGGLSPSKKLITNCSREIPRHQDLLFSLLISLRQRTCPKPLLIYWTQSRNYYGFWGRWYS